MARHDIKEYPCVEIDGVLHITVSGSQCACGKKYEYTGINTEGTIVIRSPLIWRTLPEITCEECRNSLQQKKKNMEKQAKTQD